MKKFEKGSFLYSNINDLQEIQKVLKEIEDEEKIEDQALKDYKKPVQTQTSMQVLDGTKVYGIDGFLELGGASIIPQDFINYLKGKNYTSKKTNIQYYCLFEGILKTKVLKDGTIRVSINKRNELFKQAGKFAWGSRYPGGPICKEIIYGGQPYFFSNNYNDMWFSDYNLAKAKFDDNVANGYEYKY